MNGLVTLKYILSFFNLSASIGDGIPELADWMDKDYGVVFEAPATAISILFAGTEKRDVILFRHLLTFFAFLWGGFSVYQIARIRFKQTWLPVLIIFMYFISPRQFAEGFYNSKDIVFMSAFITGIWTHLLFLQKPTVGLAVLAAMSAALLIDIRIVGIILPCFTTGLFAIKIIKQEYTRPPWRSLAIYAVLLPLFIIVFWPYLWSAPFQNFIQSFANMSHFRWDHIVLFSGKDIPAADLPWYYVPVWILISTPVVYTLFFVLGTVTIAIRLFRSSFHLWKNENEMIDVFLLSMVLLPVCIVIVQKSVIYDGWRQLYFIYPAILLVSLAGVDTLSSFYFFSKLKRVGRTALLLPFIITFIVTTVWMVRFHPYQNVYFNRLAGSDRCQNWEVDYWGLSNYELLSFILKNDPSPIVTVGAVSFMNLQVTAWLFNKEEQSRLQFIEATENPAYLINNFRRSKDISPPLTSPRHYHEIYRIEVDHEPVSVIYKRDLSN